MTASHVCLSGALLNNAPRAPRPFTTVRLSFLVPQCLERVSSVPVEQCAALHPGSFLTSAAETCSAEREITIQRRCETVNHAIEMIGQCPVSLLAIKPGEFVRYGKTVGIVTVPGSICAPYKLKTTTTTSEIKARRLCNA